MAKEYIAVRKRIIRGFLRGLRSITAYDITITIEHAHDNEWQILLPDKREFLRLIDMGSSGVCLYEV